MPRFLFPVPDSWPDLPDADRIHDYLERNAHPVRGVAPMHITEGVRAIIVEADEDPTELLSRYVDGPTRAEQERMARREAVARNLAVIRKRTSTTLSEQTILALVDLLRDELGSDSIPE